MDVEIESDGETFVFNYQTTQPETAMDMAESEFQECYGPRGIDTVTVE